MAENSKIEWTDDANGTTADGFTVELWGGKGEEVVVKVIMPGSKRAILTSRKDYERAVAAVEEIIQEEREKMA